MDDFDNIVILYDEDGNEVEFEIVHYCEYKGVTYYVLWGTDEDDEDIYLVTKKDEDSHTVVHDDDVIEFVQKSFNGSMSDLMDEVDAFAVKSDFMRELQSIINDEPGAISSEENRSKAETAIQSSPGKDIKIKPFDPTEYLQRSQDYLFIEGDAAYGKENYETAFSFFFKG